MAEKQLKAPRKTDRVAQLLKAIDAQNTNNNKDDFKPPSTFQKDVKESPKDRLDGQKPAHRTALLWLIGCLSAASFLFLAGVIVFQMEQRIENPEYVGVSDTVINILATGVFAELIGTVAVIARQVWKDPS